MFNALDLMENKVFLEKLKFGIGDGNLQYYLYNWKCPPMDPDKVCSLNCSTQLNLHLSVELFSTVLFFRKSFYFQGLCVSYFIYLVVYLMGTMHINEHYCIKNKYARTSKITTFHLQFLGRTA